MRQLAEGIWLADGPEVVALAGFHYPTRMAIIQLSDDGLFIWSPVALDNELAERVDRLGAVRHIVAPNSLHHLNLDAWHARYPDAELWAAPGLREKRKDIDFDAELLEGAAPSAWAEDIDQVAFAGNSITTEIVFFHRASRTVLFTDLLQQMPRGWYRGWRAIVARLDLMTEPEPTVPRKFRLAFRDRAAAKKALKQVLSWPAERVVMAHGTPVERDGSAFVKRAFSWLEP